MWQCSKCPVQHTNPEAHTKHVETCNQPLLKEVSKGWQGLLLDGVPKDRRGILLSELFSEWKNIQLILDNTK